MKWKKHVKVGESKWWRIPSTHVLISEFHFLGEFHWKNGIFSAVPKQSSTITQLITYTIHHLSFFTHSTSNFPHTDRTSVSILFSNASRMAGCCIGSMMHWCSSSYLRSVYLVSFVSAPPYRLCSREDRANCSKLPEDRAGWRAHFISVWNVAPMADVKWLMENIQ